MYTIPGFSTLPNAMNTNTFFKYYNHIVIMMATTANVFHINKVITIVIFQIFQT